MANPTDIELHASGEETASGNGDAVELGATRSCVRLALVVTAISNGTAVPPEDTVAASLVVAIETAPLESGPWRLAGSFSAVTTTSKTEKTFAGLDAYVRAVRTIAGTDAAVTFSLDGTAHTLYAGPSDLSRTAINATAISGIADDVLAECCLRSSDDADDALNSSYELPLTAWGESLRGHCAARAVFYAMNHRGRKPGTGADSLIDQAGGHTLEGGGLSAAERYFTSVRDGKLKPVGIVDQTPDDYEGGGVVVSGTPLYS